MTRPLLFDDRKQGFREVEPTRTVLKRITKYSAIDLFSGCGGLSYGFERAGITTSLAVDNWADALKTFNHNHPKSSSELVDLGRKDLAKFMSSLPQVDVVFGGPPCQGFSISGKRDPNDPRNLLYKGFYEVVAQIMPRVFLMENVPNLVLWMVGD